MVGGTISHYTIGDKLGEEGMVSFIRPATLASIASSR
jgi:hypothetical protein